MRRVLLAGVVALLPLGALVGLTWASPADGVSPSLIARGTFPSFNVRSDPKGPVDFRAHASNDVDVVVRRHDYRPFSHTGWHNHPGPVFVQVTKGELVVYEYGDKDCTRHELEVGDGYVDTGRGHIIRNETGEPAQDVSVIMAPIDNGAFRGELQVPARNCGA